MTVYRIVDKSTGVIVTSVDTTEKLISRYLNEGQEALRLGDELMINDADLMVVNGVMTSREPQNNE